jgi:hypothetical protein
MITVIGIRTSLRRSFRPGALLLAATVVGPALAARPAAAQSPLDALAWMGGCWESGGGERSALEMWMPPAGGLMVGAGRTVVGGQARAWEHLRLREDGEGIVYTAIPSGQAETDFRSVSVDADGFVVENLEHDFPQRIAYRRVGADSLSARVEGPGPNNTSQGFTIAMRRVDCRTP